MTFCLICNIFLEKLAKLFRGIERWKYVGCSFRKHGPPKSDVMVWGGACLSNLMILHIYDDRFQSKIHGDVKGRVVLEAR